MKDEIEAILMELVGMALIETGRAVDMQMFTFGRADRTGFSLHVQCPWRIERSGALVVGYRDMRDPPAGVPAAAFDPNDARLNRRDELLEAFVSEIRARSRRIVGIEASDVGDLRLDFDDASMLSVFPDSVAIDDEYWRLIRLPSGGDHYVVGGDGFVHMPVQPLVPPT